MSVEIATPYQDSSIYFPFIDHLAHPLSTSYCFRTSRRPRPIPNSYWATPFLLACEYPYSPTCTTTNQKIDLLLDAGVRTFIDLTESGELSPYTPHLDSRIAQRGISVQDVEYHSFPIHDRSLPESLDYVRHILDVLRDNESRGRITAVHCRGGIGRTGLIVGCWLVECGRAKNGEEALNIIAEEWKTVEKVRRFPHSPETGAQCDYVKNFVKLRTPLIVH